MRLGILAVVCALLLTGCSPKGELKGLVIVGQDAGVLVAYIGFCYDSTQTISILEKDRQPVAYLEKNDPDGVARVELRTDRAPEGWQVDRWRLPQVFTISARATRETLFSSTHQAIPEQQVDMATTTPLPQNAAEQATADC